MELAKVPFLFYLCSVIIKTFIMKEQKHPILKALHKIEKTLQSNEIHPNERFYLEIEKTNILTICN